MIDPELLIQRIDSLAENLFVFDPIARDKYRFILRDRFVEMISADPDKMGTIAAANDDQICRMLELNIAKLDKSEQPGAEPEPQALDTHVPPPDMDRIRELQPEPEPGSGPKAGVATFAKPAAGAQPRPKIIYCCQCGEVNPFNAMTCFKCGSLLHEPVRMTNPFPRGQAQVSGGSQASTNPLFPEKNPKALVAYYLGVFCILQLFCMGLPILSIPAVVFGILGLQHQKKYPEAKGGNHALVGVIVGGLMTIISLFVLFGVIIASAHH